MEFSLVEDKEEHFAKWDAELCGICVEKGVRLSF